jgi:hypothetical protein
MRIIGTIDHPTLKITVFKMNERLSVKLESGLYEQTFKFRSGEGVDTLEDVKNFIDAGFIEGVSENLQRMHQLKMQALSRQLPETVEEEFEEII